MCDILSELADGYRDIRCMEPRYRMLDIKITLMSWHHRGWSASAGSERPDQPQPDIGRSRHLADLAISNDIDCTVLVQLHFFHSSGFPVGTSDIFQRLSVLLRSPCTHFSRAFTHISHGAKNIFTSRDTKKVSQNWSHY